MSVETLLEAARSAWPFDWEPIDMGVEDGIVWAITPGRQGGINGYAMIPTEGHPWSAGVPKLENNGSEESAADVLEVHGGITYHDGRWLGFDTMHACDIWPAQYDPRGACQNSSGVSGDMDRYWTVDDVVEEAKRLARQLAVVGKET